MFRMWCMLWKEGHLLKDITLSDAEQVNRTAKVFRALEEVCREWDLAKPIWLQSNIKDFKQHSKTRFRRDSFTEQIDFDYLEIQIIEED